MIFLRCERLTARTISWEETVDVDVYAVRSCAGGILRSRRHFDHRKPWIVDRINTLSAILSMDCAALACLSNHLHIVAYVDNEKVQRGIDDEVMGHELRFSREDSRDCMSRVILSRGNSVKPGCSGCPFGASG